MKIAIVFIFVIRAIQNGVIRCDQISGPLNDASITIWHFAKSNY